MLLFDSNDDYIDEDGINNTDRGFWEVIFRQSDANAIQLSSTKNVLPVFNTASGNKK